jgi:hypothetical protein
MVRFPELEPKRLEEWAKGFLKENNKFPESWDATDGDYPGDNMIRLLELLDENVSVLSDSATDQEKPRPSAGMLERSGGRVSAEGFRAVEQS